jgi:hypothetical protein
MASVIFDPATSMLLAMPPREMAPSLSGGGNTKSSATAATSSARRGQTISKNNTKALFSLLDVLTCNGSTEAVRLEKCGVGGEGSAMSDFDGVLEGVLEGVFCIPLEGDLLGVCWDRAFEVSSATWLPVDSTPAGDDISSSSAVDSVATSECTDASSSAKYEALRRERREAVFCVVGAFALQ